MSAADCPQDIPTKIERPAPLRERVVHAIRELILSRKLAPGQHLVENELAEALGVSRQPVREALQLLNTEGWVDLRPGYGAFVHAPTEAEVDQLLVVRATLEAESARLAALNVDTEDVARLRKLCRRGEEAATAEDIDETVAADAELHRTLAELSGNQVLLDFVSQVDRRVRGHFTPLVRHRGRQSWEEHSRLVDAIENADAELAERVMREHTEQTRRTYHELREEDSGPEHPS